MGIVSKKVFVRLFGSTGDFQSKFDSQSTTYFFYEPVVCEYMRYKCERDSKRMDAIQRTFL